MQNLTDLPLQIAMQRTEGQNSDTVEIKRERVDSGDSSVDSLDPKRVRLNSSNSEGIVSEGFLDILEEDVETEPQIQGLELVIRSLEEEINPTVPADLIDLVLNEPDQIELGYLLEASDDELGLPPADSIDECAESLPNNTQMADLTSIPSSENDDSLAHSIAGVENQAGDSLTIDDLFEYGGRMEESDFPELQWRPESMPAL